MVKEFKEFILRGNVVDLAVAVIIGAAFTAIVNSLVKDIFMPIIGYVLGGVDFANMFIVIGGGAYATLAEAQKAGAATIKLERTAAIAAMRIRCPRVRPVLISCLLPHPSNVRVS